MKKLILFTFFFLHGLIVFGQKSDTSATTIKDTAGSKANRSSKIKIVDGAAMTSSDDIVENISASKEFTVFDNALKTAGLIETFTSKGPITVFAPDNTAFEKLPSGKIDTLLKPMHKTELVNLLTYHAIPGKISSKDIEKQIRESKGKAIFTTLSGGKLTAILDENRNIVLIDDNGGKCIVSKFDIQQSNGMLHVLNGVLIPKNKAI